MDVLRKNIKNPRIEVKPDCKLRVVAPPSVDIDSLIEDNKDWIEKKRSEIRELVKDTEGLEDKLLFDGDFFDIYFDEDFNINRTQKFIKANDSKELKQKLKRQLRDELDLKVQMFSNFLNVRHEKMFIRTQKRKWASCSGKGNLNFNLKMLAIPANIREYIVIHELVHLIEHRHNKRFWQLVECHYPYYKEAEQDLKKYWLWIEKNNAWDEIL